MNVEATYKLLIDWNGDGDFLDAGEDVTSDLLSASVVRGFVSPLARIARVGSARFVLKNLDKTYSPPLNSDVLPRREVRYTMTYDATEETLFEGYIDEIDASDRPETGMKTVTISCVDAMDLLVRFEGDIALDQNVYADDLISSIVSAVYTPAGTDYDEGINVFPFAADRWSGELAEPTGQGPSSIIQNVKASQKILDACTADWGRFFIAKNGYPTYRNRHATIFDDSTELTINNTQSGIQYRKSSQPIINYVAVDCYPRKAGETYEVLGALDQTHAPILEDGEDLTLDIRFRDPANNAIRLGGFNIVALVAGEDYICTPDETGEGDDESGDVSTSRTDYGRHSEITLTNGAGHPLWLQKLQVRGYAVRSYESVTMVGEDSTSQTAYGKRVLRISANLMSNPIHAKNLADYLVMIRKDPLDEIPGVTFWANINATLLEAARDLELLDRVALDEDQTGIDDSFYVYSIRHDIRQWHEHYVTLGLAAPYDYGQDPFTIGTSELDGPDILAY